MKKCLGVLIALFFVVASASASAIYNFSINATSESSLTVLSLTCTGMPGSCSSVKLSQVTVTSVPGTGATLSSLVVGSALDVATFTGKSGQSWTFDLDTSAITGVGTFNFTSASTVSGSAGLLKASGALVVSKTAAMPELSAFWSLLLVLVPVFFVGLRPGRSASSPSPAL